jgi:hypothetical protein
MPPSSNPDFPLFLLTPEQPCVASQPIQAGLDEADQLTFLQGSAGTGKPVFISVLKKLDWLFH